MFESLQSNDILDLYLIPWGIKVFYALLILFFGNVLKKIVVNIIRKILVRTSVDEMLINFVCSLTKAGILVFVIIAAIDQLGVETTSLVAILGAAGLAVGFALQGSLQNFASGVMLVIFHPFKAGDFIEAGGVIGVVERISIFNTIMKTPDNKEVIVPNGAIYGGVITNFSAKPTRRIDLVFGIGYGDDLKKAKTILEKIVLNNPRVLKDPKPQIVVGELADSSVNFNVRPWVKSGDYWDVYFELTETVKVTFDQEGISIPFPQMDVHLDKVIK